VSLSFGIQASKFNHLEAARSRILDNDIVNLLIFQNFEGKRLH